MNFLAAILWGLMGTSMTTAFFFNKDGPEVDVTEGKVRGDTSKLFDGTTFYSFKGIPFAQPPVGNLRFKAPLAPKPWAGVLDATRFGEDCPHISIHESLIKAGNEDCLFINVFTKTLDPDAKLPVMVFIYGGGFRDGSGDEERNGPKFLMQHDIILVTFNYRLEVLGFLCLDTPEVPGNAGLKDQAAALGWIQRNIAQFGGNPNNVTIFGQSAGGASVTFHLLSPMTKGMFHKAIIQSGTFFSDWALGVGAKERAFRLGKLLGKDTDNTTELLEFFQSRPAIEFINVTQKVMTEDESVRGMQIHFVPVVEKRFDGVLPFVDDEPANILNNDQFSKVPVIVGFTDREGIFMLEQRLEQASRDNRNPDNLVPRTIAERVSKAKLKRLGAEIKRFYFGNKEIGKDTIDELISYQTDLTYVYNAHRFAHFYSRANLPIYMYRFSLDTEMNRIQILVSAQLGMKKINGACHGDDVFYFFDTFANRLVYIMDKDLQNLVFTTTKLWTDFAITGEPTPHLLEESKWKPISKYRHDYYDINKEPRPNVNEEAERVEFWNDMYCDAGVPCIEKEHKDLLGLIKKINIIQVLNNTLS